MDRQPERPFNKFFVEVTEDTLRSSHYFPADYDEDCFPIGERHKVTVTICQSEVLVELFNLTPDYAGGIWRWVRTKDFRISLPIALHSGFDAVFFTEYDAEGDVEEVEVYVPEE
jgi:hypothetical protein